MTSVCKMNLMRNWVIRQENYPTHTRVSSDLRTVKEEYI